MSGKRPSGEPGEDDHSETKRPNTNPSQSPDPNPASLSPDRSSDGSVSSSYGSVGTGSSVSSGSVNRRVVDLTNRLRNRFKLDEAAIRALLDDRQQLPDDDRYRSVLPGGNRFYDEAMIAMSSGTDEESSDSSPPPPRVPATGHLAYTGPFLFHDSELNLAPGEQRHRFWGACVNEVRLLLPSSAIMRDMRRDRGIRQGLDFPLFCNLTVEEIEGAIAHLRGILPAADLDYRNHLGGTHNLVDAGAPPCDPRTAELYRLLVANCLPAREGFPDRGVWEERCRVRDTVQVLAPVLAFRDLEFLCSPLNRGIALQDFLNQHHYGWLDRNLQMDYLHSVHGGPHLLAQFRVDLKQRGSDLNSANETDRGSDGGSVSVSGSGSVSVSGSGSVISGSGSGSGSVISGSGSGDDEYVVDEGEGESFGGKRRKPATKRKARRSASSKRKPTSAAKRRRTATKSKRTRRTRVRRATRRN